MEFRIPRSVVRVELLRSRQTEPIFEILHRYPHILTQSSHKIELDTRRLAPRGLRTTAADSGRRKISTVSTRLK